MPDLLLELFSEEIPARMQARAEEDLARLMTEALEGGGLTVKARRTYSGPRRIAFVAEGVPSSSASTVEERKGPRVGAPDKAIAGFLRSAGLADIGRCDVVHDPKGDYYLARLEKPGRAAAQIIAEAVPEAVRRFPWPKSMRWGTSRIRWVRPLHSILCLFDDKPVEFEVDGIKSGDVTYGHRFLSGQKATEPKTIRIEGSKSYADSLLHAKVVAAREQRVEAILKGANKVAREAGLALVEDHGLLEENAGLVEWPVALSGEFDETFLDVPEEILITSMKAHQKCFSLRHKGTGKLANRFILVSNLEARDGGKAIIAGNERVIRARLTDAKFFWENDLRRPMQGLVHLLGQVTFHEKLGTQLERVERIRRLARELSPVVGADPDKAEEAANLAKADLMSETVGEFPELQGIIGRYIALAQGHDPSVAEAIAEHYKPVGQADTVPANPVSVAVALADKLDMLASFWTIDEKPTGSKDPYALRRAALGVIRTVLENGIRLRLLPAITLLMARLELHLQAEKAIDKAVEIASAELGLDLSREHDIEVAEAISARFGELPTHSAEKAQDLLKFFADRLKVHLREKGARYDLIDAVFALPGQDDLFIMVRRVEALGRFLQTDDGASLLVLIRRALNILRIEEKKDAVSYDARPAARLLKQKEEKDLNSAIAAIGGEVEAALAAEDFEAAMAALAKLRAPVDTFFDKVTVNADDPALRENRLKLLARIRALTLQIADFSKIEG